MLIELNEGLGAASRAPKQQLVVVAARGELLVIEGPLEPAHLLPVTEQLCSVILRCPQVSMQDAMVAATSAQEGIVPRNGANTSIVASHRLQKLVLSRVPDLEISCVGAYGEKGTIAGPLDASHPIIRSDVTQFCDFTVHCGPEVDARAETYGQNVLRRPINQVEVEIVLQAGGVEDFEGLRGDHALLLVLLGEQFLLVESTVDGQGHSL